MQRRPRRLLAGAITAAVTLVVGQQAIGAEDPNKVLYLRYCGACHGPAGKGNGIVSGILQTKPADLTQIAKKNGGEFPFQKVVETIDGRNTVRAHGDPEMPIWGEVLRRESVSSLERQAEVQGKVMFITEYLRSIQEK